MTDSGVIYIAWGENAIEQAKQSIYSLRRFLPEIPVLIVGDDAAVKAFEDDETIDTHLCEVDPFTPDRKKGFRFSAGRIKPLLAKISPFEKSLYVDCDTYFQRPPTEGFQLLDKWDAAIAETETRSLDEGIADPRECIETAKEMGTGLLLYHNSGMIFWRRNERTKALFDLWSEEWERYQGWDEQVALLRALLRSEAVYLTLPHTWNTSALSKCYMLYHWFGAGDARIDMKQRTRQYEKQEVKQPRLPMIRIELAPGQFVKCRPEDREKVLEQFGLKVEEQVKENNMNNKNNPLVKVFSKPGQYVKMRLKDAEELGLEYTHEKGRAPHGNKMRLPGENKDLAESSSHKGTDELKAESKETEKDPAQFEDFTAISGVGKATDEKLHEQGVHTFEDLLAADVSFLPGAAQSAIEAWREGF